MSKQFGIDKYGIWFLYKGDSVCYAWIWSVDRRKNFNNRFYSTSFEMYFSTLSELDEMWNGYFEEMSELEDINDYF